MHRITSVRTVWLHCASRRMFPVNGYSLVICFLLDNSPASEFYMPTFRNTLFYLHRQASELFTYLPMKMEQTECFETSAYKIQTPGNYPEENIQHTKHVGYLFVSFCFLRRSISWDTISSNLARMIGTILLPADLNCALIDISD
jgi:hypothetical protein